MIVQGLAWQALALAAGAFIGAVVALVTGHGGDLSYMAVGAIGSLVAFNLPPAYRGKRLP